MTGDANGKLRGEGLYLGAQGLYAPADWDGWNVFGIGRLGVENWRMKRAVSFNGYNRENNKDWTGFSGSVRAGGGYEADWGTIKAGPFAALDYAFSSRPSLTEDNGMGSRLHLDSETFHSLRSSLGIRMSTNERQLGEHATWKAHASAAWNHELLDKAGTMHASCGSGQRGLLQHCEGPGPRQPWPRRGRAFQHGQARLFLLKRRERTFPP